jgi:hypothetical protein
MTLPLEAFEMADEWHEENKALLATVCASCRALLIKNAVNYILAKLKNRTLYRPS